ncbi:MAG: thiamine diphosphokinase [Clostridia bacterium]|nr:thiamine diphosphokinase [Clostridia bacterium]
MKERRAIIYCWSESDLVPFEKEDGDYIICADSGTEYAKRLGVKPDAVIGDFDSSKKPSVTDDFETVVLPHEKDDTDALFAARFALNKGFKKIYLAGGLGGRLDHTLGAIAVLRFIEKNGAECVICDGKTRVSLIRSETEKRFVYSENTEYVSVFPSEGESQCVEIRGFKYCLNGFNITSDFPIGVSNEPVSGEDGYIKAGKGDLIAVEIFN